LIVWMSLKTAKNLKNAKAFYLEYGHYIIDVMTVDYSRPMY